MEYTVCLIKINISKYIDLIKVRYVCIFIWLHNFTVTSCSILSSQCSIDSTEDAFETLTYWNDPLEDPSLYKPPLLVLVLTH